MRTLTKRQKVVLDREMARDPELRKWEDLSLEVIEELERINDTEILSSQVSNYMHDVVWERIK